MGGACPAHCWFPSVDRVPRDAETSAWKLQARIGQARWREARGFPIGSKPYTGGGGATPVGSRLELGFAKASTANFITPAALSAVQHRLAHRPAVEDVGSAAWRNGDEEGDESAARGGEALIVAEEPGGTVHDNLAEAGLVATTTTEELPCLKMEKRAALPR